MKLEYYVYIYLIKHYFVVSLLYFGANNPFQVSYIVVGSGKAHRPWALCPQGLEEENPSWRDFWEMPMSVGSDGFFVPTPHPSPLTVTCGGPRARP